LYVKHLEACERIAFFVLRREFIKDFKNWDKNLEEFENQNKMERDWYCGQGGLC
jgi:hypothetical protein